MTQTGKNLSHMTHQFPSVLQAESKMPQGSISNLLTYSQSFNDNEIQNNMKEALKSRLHLVSTGLVSEKISARQPQVQQTSIF